ncbi:Bug family tripartite tricarboxylate transporter substrate binding protein [Achromobacter aloeverae]|uniref:Tripartite tricarboxylate transporter substrate binding protein n=1 Tax=Achromobacter aloeverae TaxID=1750518 RepID=A0A4Q1HHK8_9BURK|nr:tripartite tricarboxylate transporter substrate binding protein [Achromobacter aloeverae]RXN86144.1 tripartite tricarboxylate transporter substrate binding protein [Achromobacter aloeverae]
MQRRSLLKLLAASAVPAPFTWMRTVRAAESGYATKPIRLVVPYPPGGVTDVAGRLASDILSTRFGQPVVVENRPGANGMIGNQHVAAAPPDGYTLLLNGLGGMVLPMATVTGLPLDTSRAFTPIGEMAEFINVLIVRADSPLRTVDDLIALARLRSKEGLSYGSNGIGTSVHLTTAFFAQRTGLHLLHVPYKGSNEMLVDVINGNLDFSFSNLPPVQGLLRKGSLRAIAVTSSYRSQQLPDVPTMAEQGLADFNVTSWLGLYGPAGMAPALVQTLSAALQEGMATPRARETLSVAGFEPKGSTAAAFAELNRTELARWKQVAQRADISLKFGT